MQFMLFFCNYVFFVSVDPVVIVRHNISPTDFCNNFLCNNFYINFFFIRNIFSQDIFFL